MGTPGVPWECDKSTIVEHLKKAKGRITYAARSLNVHFQTLHKRIHNDPELIKLLSELRNELDTTLLDSAENCLLYALSKQDSDLGNALKSSFYILNNKGADRGYFRNTDSRKDAPPNDASLNDIIDALNKAVNAKSKAD